jgi:spermidine/putrescine ABC transporter ATP-binding subunit
MSNGGEKQHALSLRHLTKRYGEHVAIEDVTLDVAPGEFLSLLGPSGSGKTSILMAIAGFVVPDAGDILLDGVRINELPPEKRNFGVVFQGYALFPHMTVRANIGYPLSVRGVPRAKIAERVARVLDLVQLGQFADRFPRQLSGGQQQRVALGRALIFEPAVVLLDEPLSALDKKLRAELELELKSLHARLGTTFINVTHDQEEAMTMSDRIVILREGRIVQIGSPAELYHRPATRFVAEFLGRATFLSGIVVTVEGNTFVLRVGDTSVRSLIPGGDLKPGEPAVLALRPERIVVVETVSQDPVNRLPGTISSTAFMGMQHFYIVDTPVGLLAALVPSFGSGPLKEVGTSVYVEWPIDAAVHVAEAGTRADARSLLLSHKSQRESGLIEPESIDSPLASEGG